MGDSPVRKSLISEKQRAKVAGEPSGKSASKAKSGSDGSGDAEDAASTRKMRVIAMTSVFVLLLAFVAYKYGWSDREPPYEPPAPSEPQAEPAAPGQPRTAPPPPEKQPERHDVIQG